MSQEKQHLSSDQKSSGAEKSTRTQGKVRRHKAYSAEFREKAVKMITELGYTAREVAQQLDCSLSAVQRWKSEMTPLDPVVCARMSLEEDENKRLRKENLRLKMENEILKKATAYFAKETL